MPGSADIHGIPDPSRPEGVEESLVPITPDGRKWGIRVRQMRERLRFELTIRQPRGHALKDYLPDQQLQRLFGGLPPADEVFVLHKDDRAWFRSIMKEEGVRIPDGDNEGSSIPILGVAIVWWDPVREDRLGKEYTAGIIVHEMAHSAHAWKNNTLHLRTNLHDNPDDAPFGTTTIESRLGFSVSDMSIFFEEGFVEFMRARYLKTFARKSLFMQRIHEDLGIPAGKNLENIIVSVQNPSGIVTRIPAIRLYPGPSGKVDSANFASYACQAIVELCKADPGFEEVLYEARRSFDGLRHFWSAVRRLVGEEACSALRRLQVTNDDGASGLKMVRDALGR